ncbi:MAG TPA: N-acetylmuramoyl-L-alanine amidase [Myxococcota bacterium]|nr:N-acetylmuramoyl-L-alanine amidase [Myxococcota bacterium]
MKTAVISVLFGAAIPFLFMVVPASALAQEFQPPTSGFQPAATAFPYGAALAGKRIVISPGHGWEGDSSGGFQRGNVKFQNCGTCEGITEDIYNAEFCTDHLVPMLRQAGARVYVVRQVDRQRASVTVDDGDAGYSEVAPWGTGTTGGLGWQGDYRTLNGNIAGEATWTLQVPVEGDYWVQMRWAAGTNRCTDARVRVSHAGGVAEFQVNQQIDGSMWVPLARLHFQAGPATVTLDHPPAVGCYIVADAVRLGGGVDSYSGKSWWQVSALDWLAETGPGAIASGYNDVTIRPALANYLDADLFISFHGNANENASARGTSTYRYNCDSGVQWDELDPGVCDDPSGSAALQYSVQEQVMLDLWSYWDDAFQDDGSLVGNFGELRVLDTVPGFMVESAFFSNTSPAGGQLFSDNQSMHDPRFRRIVARGILQGIVSELNPAVPIPPEPPTHLSLTNDGGGALVAKWRTAAGAAGYRVYKAVGGRGFDGGTIVTGNSLKLTGLASGAVVAVRVTSLNAGGESTPSPAVAASPGKADILVVNAFDRLDAWVREDHNHRDYVIEHGLALAQAGLAFDGALDEAAIDGDVFIEEYGMLDWALGRESTAAVTINDYGQGELRAYQELGGCILVSGTEIAWDLGNMGTAAEVEFLAQVLGAEFAADDAISFVVQAEPEGPWADMGSFGFDDGSGGTYRASYPDVLLPAAGAQVLLRYGTGGAAAVGLVAGEGRAVTMGFPIETINSLAVRADLFERIVDFCGLGENGTADDSGEQAADEALADVGPGDNGGFDQGGGGDQGTSADVWDYPDLHKSDTVDAGGGTDLSENDAGQGDDVADAGADGGSDSAIPVADSVVADRWATDHGDWEFPNLNDAREFGVDDEQITTGGCSAGTAAGSAPTAVMLLVLMLAVLLLATRRLSTIRKGE